MMKIVITSSNDINILRAISKVLLESGLSACNQILTNVESHFKWKSKNEKEIESLLIIKTTSQNINSVKDLIEEHHNYDIPEIIDINASILNDSYQEWFNQVLK